MGLRGLARVALTIIRRRMQRVMLIRRMRAVVLYSHDWVWVSSERRWCCMSCGAVGSPHRPRAWRSPCPARLADDEPAQRDLAALNRAG